MTWISLLNNILTIHVVATHILLFTFPVFLLATLQSMFYLLLKGGATGSPT